jgi:hypothetical protein
MSLTEREGTVIELQGIKGLTIDERAAARQAARAALAKYAGDEPKRTDFQSRAARYPAWMMRLITAAMLIVFVSAAAPSLFRLFTAGRDYFLKGIPDAAQAAAAGAATFLMAEFMVIVSTLVMRIFFVGRARLLMGAPILLGIAMALVGNWVIEQPSDLFGWLITIAPPAAVLFMSLIGEKLLLEAIEQRHANEQAYQQALGDWKAAGANPESSSRWAQTYANTLKDALAAKNGRYKAGREALPLLTAEHWKTLVWREMRADNWFDAESPESPDLPESPILAETALVAEESVTVPFGSTARTADARANGRMTSPGSVIGGGRIAGRD